MSILLLLKSDKLSIHVVHSSQNKHRKIDSFGWFSINFAFECVERGLRLRMKVIYISRCLLIAPQARVNKIAHKIKEEMFEVALAQI